MHVLTKHIQKMHSSIQFYHLPCMSEILNSYLFNAPCIELHNALYLSHVSHHP
jgi:hypothetical protein